MPRWKLPHGHRDQPRVVQLAAILADADGGVIDQFCHLVQCDVPIPPGAAKVHGITNEMVMKNGTNPDTVLDAFETLLEQADLYACHNLNFDLAIILAMYAQQNRYCPLQRMDSFCTMKAYTNVCCIPGKNGKNKWPSLQEAYRHAFARDFSGAHNALADAKATMEIFFQLN